MLGMLVVWMPLAALAQGMTVEGATASADEDLANLLAILDEETEIATKTKMNSDFVPGIVTVLEGDQLEALGVRTVWEALSLVPGVEPIRDVVGSPSVVVRGIDFPFNSGNIKIMVDSVPLNREVAGLNGGVLLIPIEQVERIEVIRGPGSVMYGEFAFMGLVNIVTRHDENRVFVTGDSNDTGALGAIGSWKSADGLELSANLAGWRSNDTAVATPHTAEERRRYGNVALRKGGLEVVAQVFTRKLNGTSEPAPMIPGIGADETTWATNLRWTHQLGDQLELTAHAVVLDTDISTSSAHFDDRIYRGALDLGWDGIANQSWLGSVEYSASHIGNATQMSRPVPGGPPPPAFHAEDVNRDVVSITLQDRVDLSEKLSVTAGLRFSDYSDVSGRLTPRLSLVWRPSEHHIVKAQYAEGFRSPTFFEEYGGGARNPDIDFEVNETSELNYVYRRPRLTARVTLFRSEIRDMIFSVPRTPTFANGRSARAEGVELEWTQQVTPWLKLLASASRAHTRDNRGRMSDFHQAAGESNGMGNLAILLQPAERLLVSSRLFHVGSRDAGPSDPYDLLDCTVTVRRILGNTDLRVGVKDALEDSRDYLFTTPGGTQAHQYPGNRTVWAQISWSR